MQGTPQIFPPPHWCSISLSETNDMAKPLEEPVSVAVLTGDRQVEELE